mgnify:CR=1 FL=1
MTSYAKKVLDNELYWDNVVVQEATLGEVTPDMKNHECNYQSKY